MNDDELIRSLQNPRVKQVVRLRDRRDRDRDGQFLIEGYRELSRAVAVGQPLATVFCSSRLYLGSNEPALLEQAKQQCGALIQPVTEEVFRKISYRDRPDGLLAVAPRPDWGLQRLEKTDPSISPLYLVAQSIEKPGNLGTILRTADAAGVDGVVVVDRCTDLYNPNVVRASVGTLFSVPVAEATSDEALAWFQQRGVRLFATSPDATQLYSEANLTGPMAIVMGSEQYGLDARWLENTDEQISIPMAGLADSLNVATSTAIVLFEALRQRRSD
ncbi:MAG: RNA methyltransferase [Planctomycetota bacterium]